MTAVVIPKRLGSGGAFLAPGGQAGKPTLLTLLEAAANDLAGIKVAAIAADGSVAVSAITAITQDALTDSSAGTANTTIEALPNPTDTPATADALRDDLVAVLIPALRNNFADLAAQLAKIRTDNTANTTNLTDIRTQFNLLRTLVLDIRTKIDTAAAYTVTLTKAS